LWKDTKEKNLVLPDGLSLATFIGCYAFFSSDSKYLFYVSNNSLCRFPVDMKEIKELLDKYKHQVSGRKGNKLIKVL
jgi:hypothetical protein